MRVWLAEGANAKRPGYKLVVVFLWHCWVGDGGKGKGCKLLVFFFGMVECVSGVGGVSKG